jgi:hypothetical protein
MVYKLKAAVRTGILTKDSKQSLHYVEFLNVNSGGT